MWDQQWFRGGFGVEEDLWQRLVVRTNPEETRGREVGSGEVTLESDPRVGPGVPRSRDTR